MKFKNVEYMTRVANVRVLDDRRRKLRILELPYEHPFSLIAKITNWLGETLRWHTVPVPSMLIVLPVCLYSLVEIEISICFALLTPNA